MSAASRHHFLLVLAAIPPTLLFLVHLTALAAPLKAGDKDPKTGRVIKYWVAPMDPTYVRNEPGKSPMGMDLVPVYAEEGEEKAPSSTIRIDPVTMQNMGVRLGRVVRAPLDRTIRAMGQVDYDQRLIEVVSTKFNGWIEKLYVDFEGESVRRGAPLFDIYSPELVTAQEEYLLALGQMKLLGGSAISGAGESSRRLLKAAERRLRFWDVSKAQLGRLREEGIVRKNLTVFSPASGVVIKKNVFRGHYVKAGEHQYEIADLSRVWVDAEVYEYELPFVKKDMPAVMELSYLPGRRFEGRVLFIYPYLSPKTRTLRLRLEFENPDATLKPNMYANVILSSRIDDNALVAPQEAVIDSGERKVVFVYRGKGKFEPREVVLGPQGGENLVQVLSGLKQGEEVVLSAQFMLDSESRLRESIRKMLEIRSAEDKDLDMKDLKMDDMDMKDLNMDGLKTDEPAK